MVATLAGIARGGNVSVCARLPFAPIAPGNGDSALCVASIAPDESGDDRSLFVLRTSPEVSRARLNDAIAAAGVKPVRLIGRGVPMDGTSVFMAELEGFAGPDDSRIAQLTDPDRGIAESVIFLGVYATFQQPRHCRPWRGLMVLSPRLGIMDSAYVPGASKVDGVGKIIGYLQMKERGPGPKATAAYEELGSQLHRYPDGGSVELREAIGARNGLDPDRIVCGAGSDELLALLARAYAGTGDEVLFGEHAFVMYPLFALSVGATPVRAPETEFTVSVDALLSKVSDKTRSFMSLIRTIRPARWSHRTK